MKKKNVFALALAAALALSLTACGGKDSGNGGGSSPVSGSNPGSGSAAPSAEPTVVKVGVVGANNQQWDTVNELLAKDNIKVELWSLPNTSCPTTPWTPGRST